ncbi:hypothetical protein QBC34DRAFT_470761, partial [Podospora aff. communis PSN243]
TACTAKATPRLHKLVDCPDCPVRVAPPHSNPPHQMGFFIDLSHLPIGERGGVQSGIIFGLIAYNLIAAAVWVVSFAELWLHRAQVRKDLGIGTLAFLGCLIAGAIWPISLLIALAVFLCGECDSCFGMTCGARGDRGAKSSTAAAGDVEAGRVAGQPNGEEMIACPQAAHQKRE